MLQKIKEQQKENITGILISIKPMWKKVTNFAVRILYIHKSVLGLPLFYIISNVTLHDFKTHYEITEINTVCCIKGYLVI